MRRILILGAGTAGTIMANRLAHKIDRRNWQITIVDEHQTHYYQPGFLFMPFGIYKPEDVVREKAIFISKKVEFIQAAVDTIKPDVGQVVLQNGQILDYHILIIATGVKIAPEQVAGLTEAGWRENSFDFYTFEGAKALAEKLKNWPGGKLAIHIAEMPIKCPVAPLEFAFLADAYFAKKKMRDKVEINYITPASGAFTKPRSSAVLGGLMSEKHINIVPDFYTERVDGSAGKVFSYGGQKVDYDLLVTIPTNMGDEVIARSGLGDELNFVPTQKHTLQAKTHENIFVIGDATDLPSSKAGAVAHFQSDILTENILNYIEGKPLDEGFDGHANCFIESGFGKAFLIDFNYDTEPVEGRFPFPVIGPMALLKQTRLNHWGKLAFRHIYWNILLRGLPMPGIPTRMSKLGKKLSK